jgi:hypothetical protein
MTEYQTEREVVIALAQGRAPSPQYFCRNMWCTLCLAEAGAYVRADGDLAMRGEEWVSDDMLRRVIGTQIIVGDSIEKLDIDSFPQARVVGVIVHAFRDGDRLMGVARIFPDGGARQPLIASEIGRDQPQAASLHVRVDDVDLVQLDDDDGSRVLIEGAPAFISHIEIS